MANGKAGAPKGNTNGSKNKIWSDALKLELSGTRNEAKLRKLAKSLIEMAEDGNMQAMKEIGDRLEGKAAQSVDVTITDTTHEEALDMLDNDSPASHATH